MEVIIWIIGVMNSCKSLAQLNGTLVLILSYQSMNSNQKNTKDLIKLLRIVFKETQEQILNPKKGIKRFYYTYPKGHRSHGYYSIINAESMYIAIIKIREKCSYEVIYHFHQSIITSDYPCGLMAEITLNKIN
jgi:hypothetical protein